MHVGTPLKELALLLSALLLLLLLLPPPAMTHSNDYRIEMSRRDVVSLVVNRARWRTRVTSGWSVAWVPASVARQLHRRRCPLVRTCTPGRDTLDSPTTTPNPDSDACCRPLRFGCCRESHRHCWETAAALRVWPFVVPFAQCGGGL